VFFHSEKSGPVLKRAKSTGARYVGRRLMPPFLLDNREH